MLAVFEHFNKRITPFQDVENDLYNAVASVEVNRDLCYC